MSHSLELHLELGNLLGGLEQVLRVQVAVRAHRLIQVLLLLQSALRFDIFLLQLRYQVVFEFDLFETLIILGVSLRCLDTVLLFVLL